MTRVAGLYGASPEEVFRKFKEHLDRLLHKTITEAPLVLLSVGASAFLQFQRSERPICVPVGHRYHLYVGQTLQAAREDGRYRLRTLAYAYRIADGPTFDDQCFFRWEYNAREHKQSLAPRHHLQLPATIGCFGNRVLDTNKLHIPTGWVTVEEVIRFLIHELRVKPRTHKWDGDLLASERLFREWSGRAT